MTYQLPVHNFKECLNLASRLRVIWSTHNQLNSFLRIEIFKRLCSKLRRYPHIALWASSPFSVHGQAYRWRWQQSYTYISSKQGRARVVIDYPGDPDFAPAANPELVDVHLPKRVRMFPLEALTEFLPGLNPRQQPIPL